MITTNPYGIGRVGIASHCPLSIQCPIISIWYTQCQFTAMLRSFETHLTWGIIFPSSISDNVPTLRPPTDWSLLCCSPRLHSTLCSPVAAAARQFAAAEHFVCSCSPRPSCGSGITRGSPDRFRVTIFKIRLKVYHGDYLIHWFHS